MAEIVWTLESFYGLPKDEVAEKIVTILNTPNLTCPDASLIRQALDLYSGLNIDFMDACHVLHLMDEGIRKIVSYDLKHFGRIKWLELIEP